MCRSIGWVIIPRGQPYATGHMRGPTRGSIYVSKTSAIRSRMHEYKGDDKQAQVLKDYTVHEVFINE